MKLDGVASCIVPDFACSDEKPRASLQRHWQPEHSTPWRCFLDDIAERNVSDAVRALRVCPRFALNYSVKTNPRPKLEQGSDRVLGCICTEDDVIRRGVALPADIAADDVIAVADAGAYDSSMSFAFAGGRSKPQDS